MTRVYISIGSNQDREKKICVALDRLQANFDELILSSVYESESVGFVGSNFYNMVVGFDTEMDIQSLYCLMRQIENDNGRLRKGNKFSDRTLDLDILTYGDYVGVAGELVLPRDEILENAFVLQPLAEIAPHDLHPVLDKTYAELWQDYDKSVQQLAVIDFDWADKRISFVC